MAARMKRVRVIPVLGIDQGRLVKTVRFGEPRYIGDPLMAIRIFNDKEVDELIITDIRASKGAVSPSAASTSAIGGHSRIALASRSLRPASAMARALPCGIAPRPTPSQPLNTGPVLSGWRGLTSSTAAWLF